MNADIDKSSHRNDLGDALFCSVLYGVLLLCSGYTTGRDASTNQDATCNYGTVYNMHANERDDINECTRSLLQLKKEPE